MSKNILVIDDDEAVRKSFILALEDTAYRVETASTGEEGLEKVNADGYSLIFLDLKIPGIDGVETMSRIRKIDKEVKIYIITAFYAEFLDGLNKAVESGLEFEIMQKPLDSEQILSITKGILDGPAKY